MSRWLPSIYGVGRITVELENNTKLSSGIDLKWLSIENGILFWYIHEFQEVPDGFGVLCESAEWEEKQPFPLDRVIRTTIQTVQGKGKVSVAIIKEEAKFWLDILNYHVRSFHTPISVEKIKEMLDGHPYETDNNSKAITASMQITLKGKHHILEVSANDDIMSITNHFISENNIKPELFEKIESELLRTQVDACHLTQSFLSKKISFYRRHMTDILIAENRKEIAEKHAQTMSEIMQRLEGTIGQIEQDLLNSRQKVLDQEAMITQLKNDLMSSYSENIEVQEKLEYTEDSMQKKIKSLTQTLKELQEKLDEFVGEDHDTINMNTSMTTDTITSNDVNRSPSKSSSRTNPYARKMILNSKHSPRIDGKHILRQEKAKLSKQIIDLQQENKKYALELRQEINKRHSLQLLGVLPDSKGDPSGIGLNSNSNNNNSITSLGTKATETGNDISAELVERTRKAEERYRLLRTNFSLIEEVKETLRKKNESLQLNLINTTDSLYQKEQELKKVTDELNQCYRQLSIENVQTLEEENKNLSQEIVTIRGQITRMESYQYELHDALAHAIQYLQMIGPESHIVEAITLWTQLLEATSSSLLSPHTMDNSSNVPEGNISFSRRNSKSSMTMISDNNDSNNNSNNNNINSSNDLTLSAKKRRASVKSRMSHISRIHLDSELDNDDDDGNDGYDNNSSNIHSVYYDKNNNNNSGRRIGFEENDRNAITTMVYSIPSAITGLGIDRPNNNDSNSSGGGGHNTSNTTTSKLYSRANMIFHMFSPVVEDRLLRTIYSRYNIADNGHSTSIAVMTLTRFIRFAREFEFISSSGSGSVGNFLVPGEVDMIFFNASKISIDSNLKDNIKPSSIRPFCVRNHFVSYTGLLSVYPSNETLFLATQAEREAYDSGIYMTLPISRSNTDSTVNKFPTISSATVVTEQQFIAAVEQIAIHMYGRDIEKKVGTVYECLPSSQKPAAARYAVELALIRKIIPIADRLDLIPWALIYFDQALTSLSMKAMNYTILSSIIHQVEDWFNYYLSYFDSYTAESLPMLSEHDQRDVITSESKDSYHFFQGVHGHDIQSNSISKHHHGSNNNNSNANTKSSKRRHLSIHILSYKLFSRFGREFGIVPYLIKESQLFSIFQEVILWGRTDSDIIMRTLPEAYRNKESTSSQDKLFDIITKPKSSPLSNSQNKNKNSSTSSNSNSNSNSEPSLVGLTIPGFALALLTTATQSFHNQDMEARLDELCKWMSKSGGPDLIHQDIHDHSN